MKIYIAAHFDIREELRPIRDWLWTAGHQVVSSWLDEVAQPDGMDDETFRRKLARKDLAEIQSADLLILDTRVPTVRGGREVEFGFALGRFQNVLLWVVGPERNVFHTLADRVFEDWPAVFAVL